MESAYLGAQTYLRRSRLSDVEFIYTPSQIAAACFRLADETLFTAAMQKLFPSAATEADPPNVKPVGTSQPLDLLAHQDLVAILVTIQQKIEAVPADGAFDKKQVKAIDKTVRMAQDPARNISSEL